MSGRLFDPKNTHKLEDPERLVWMPPRDVVAMLRLRGGMSVADIGPGSGFFTIPFARAVEPSGRVFAVDLQPRMLEILGEKLRESGAPRNIQLVHGAAHETRLEEGTCDLVFMGNVWHELDDAAAFCREAARILRPEGRLAILDWRTDTPHPPGPPPDHRIAAADTAATLGSLGWNAAAPAHVGKYSYLVVAARPAAAR
jgi:ubiquinone/menaquinone biosynthesis C-methylase UbiE